MTALVIRLPMPPSSNNMFTNARGKGRVKSGVYVTWSNRAAWIVRDAVRAPLDRPCSVAIDLIGLPKTADIDNRVKPVLDALQNGGAITNDRLVRSLWVGAEDSPWRPGVGALIGFDFHIICEVER